MKERKEGRGREVRKKQMETETERNKEGKVKRKQDKRKEGKEAKWVKSTFTYVYAHNEILLTHAKERNNDICSDMAEPRDRNTKWSKSEKDKYFMISLMCGI